MIKVLLDTSPLDSGHALRGVGTYTRMLTEQLEKVDNLQVVRSETKAAQGFKPDLVHYPYFDLFFSTLPLVRTLPTVVTVHDVIPLIFPEHYSPGIKGRAKFIKQKSALKTTQAVITDSEASKIDIKQRLSISANKISVVYLAANPELKNVSETVLRRVKRKYQLPKNYILYVGDINYNKNIPQLIKAVKYLPRNLKLVCVGSSFKKQEIEEWQWIETQLAMSDVRNRVKFITDLPASATEDLAGIYSGSVCYVQPSLYEGFGLPLLEAMQCMTPVVSAKNSSLTEVGGEHALFAEPTGASLAAAVKEVWHWTQTQRNEVIRSAYLWSQEFSWQKTAEKTIEVYQAVLNQES